MRRLAIAGLVLAGCRVKARSTAPIYSVRFGPLSLVALGLGVAGVGTAVVLLSTGGKEGRAPSADVSIRVTGSGTTAVAHAQF